MSISPWYDLWYTSTRPSRILDQHFGLGLDNDDTLAPLIIPRDIRPLLNFPNYFRPWRSWASEKDSGSIMKMDNDRFLASLDVQQFRPDEINVKVTGDEEITIEGKHEEREDEHGFISRHFVRRYVLPKGIDISRVESKLSTDGILTISAPKVDGAQLEERTVPIVQTGKPSKPVENKGVEKSMEKGDVK